MNPEINSTSEKTDILAEQTKDNIITRSPQKSCKAIKIIKYRTYGKSPYIKMDCVRSSPENEPSPQKQLCIRSLVDKEVSSAQIVSAVKSQQNGTLKQCFVPLCENNSITNPTKMFIPVSENKKKQWCEAVGCPETSVNIMEYCCEDHFDISEDLKNCKSVTILYEKPCVKDDVVPRFNIKSANVNQMPRIFLRANITKSAKLRIINRKSAIIVPYTIGEEHSYNKRRVDKEILPRTGPAVRKKPMNTKKINVPKTLKEAKDPPVITCIRPALKNNCNNYSDNFINRKNKFENNGGFSNTMDINSRRRVNGDVLQPLDNSTDSNQNFHAPKKNIMKSQESNESTMFTAIVKEELVIDDIVKTEQPDYEEGDYYFQTSTDIIETPKEFVMVEGVEPDESTAIDESCNEDPMQSVDPLSMNSGDELLCNEMLPPSDDSSYTKSPQKKLNNLSEIVNTISNEQFEGFKQKSKNETKNLMPNEKIETQTEDTNKAKVPSYLKTKKSVVAFQCEKCCYSTTVLTPKTASFCPKCGSSKMLFYCKICSRRFASDKFLRAHYESSLTHKDEKEFRLRQLKELLMTLMRCLRCNKRYQSTYALKEHIKVCRTCNYKCPLCEYDFAKAQFLLTHIKTKHRAIRSFRCIRCNRKFIKVDKFFRHYLQCRVMADAAKICQKCNEYCPTQSHFEKHLQDCLSEDDSEDSDSTGTDTSDAEDVEEE